MECPKCGNELEKTDGEYDVKGYPENWKYKCSNKDCKYWSQHGRIINGEFKLDSELAEEESKKNKIMGKLD